MLTISGLGYVISKNFFAKKMLGPKRIERTKLHEKLRFSKREQ
jgi:hypothetical protein